MNRTVSSLYPDNGDEKFSKLFNQTVFPRSGHPTHAEKIRILFCYEGTSLSHQPNHYVPIILCDKFNADFKSSVSKRKASSCGDNAPTVMKQCKIPFLSSRKSNNLVYGTISSVPKLVFPESVVEKKKISGSSSNFTDTSDTKSPNLPDNLHLSVSSSSDFLFPKCRYDIAYIVTGNG